MSLPRHYLDTDTQVIDFISDLRMKGDSRFCAVDTEADSFHSYEAKVCLIQFATTEALGIVDPLALSEETMQSFIKWLDSFGVLWLHGADYDLSLFQKHYNWKPRKVWDTQIAARLLGAEKFGLANLLSAEFGIEVSKQSQKADWSKRPLTETMIDYAYGDVDNLIELGGRYADRLEECGRFGWFEESCQQAAAKVYERVDDDGEQESWRISGSGKMNRRELAALKALWCWRDSECRLLDRPAFKFVNNIQIMGMVRELVKSDRLREVQKHLRAAQRKRLDEACQGFVAMEATGYPEKLQSKGPRLRLAIDEGELERLKQRRDQLAQTLGIDASIIANRNVLERLSSANVSLEEKKELLMSWQLDLLDPQLELSHRE